MQVTLHRHTLSLLLTHRHKVYISLSHIHSLSLLLTHTKSKFMSHTHTHTHTHALSLLRTPKKYTFCSHIVSYKSLSHTHTLSYSHTHTLVHTHTHSRTHTHKVEMSLSHTFANPSALYDGLLVLVEQKAGVMRNAPFPVKPPWRPRLLERIPRARQHG